MSDDVLASSRSVPSRPFDRAAGRGRRFVFLDVLRAVAVLLVIYCHVVGVWLHQHHEGSVVAPFVQGFAAHPLDMALNLGNFGVVLFFLVSGFIVTHTGFTENPRQYAAKRFLRIYPMLLLSVLLAVVLFALHLHPLTTGGVATTVTPLTMLTNASLANYLVAPAVALLDVGWTLVIEVLFYVLLLAALPLLRRAVWPVIAGELALVALVMATTRLGGTSYFLFATSVSYVPALLLGQCVWAVWSRRIAVWPGVAFGAVAWLEYLWGKAPGMARTDPQYEYTVNLTLGLVVFVVFLLAEPTLRPVRWIGYVADRSYSLYLLHGLLAFVVMNALYGWIGFPAALVVGVAVTFLGADISHRFVERPCMRLARVVAASAHGDRGRAG